MLSTFLAIVNSIVVVFENEVCADRASLLLLPYLGAIICCVRLIL
jgi:hypothetical protein